MDFVTATPLRNSTPSKATRFQVFLSHAFADGPPVRLVRDQLAAPGADVYLAEHDPKPGMSIAVKIKEAIQRADVTVVLLTTDASDSAYVHQEIGAAHAYGELVVPLVGAGVDRTRLGMLSEVEWIEIDLAEPFERQS